MTGKANCVFNIRPEPNGILCGAGYRVVQDCPANCPRFEPRPDTKGR